MKTIRFSVFADLHYRDGDWNWASKRLEAILRRASERKVDFLMHCGDFCHNVSTAGTILERYNSFPIQTWHTMGNHDFEQTEGLEPVLRAYRMGEKSYYYFDVNGFRMISVDTNFYHAPDGSIAHYADSDVWAKCHQSELLIPEEEIAFLDDALETAPGPCVVFSHGSLIRPKSVANSGEVLEILRRPRRKGGRLLLWINGHHHRNNLVLRDDIAFFDLNSTTSTWINHTHHAYPAELMAKFAQSEHELLYTEPVHAIVTLTDRGELRIEGMQGGLLLGVTPESTGEPKFDEVGLACDASVLSAHFRLYPREESTAER